MPKIFGFQVGKRPKAPVAPQQMSVGALKQQLYRKGFLYLNKMFEEDPNLLREYVFDNILHKKPKTLEDRILEDQLSKNPEMQRRYAELLMNRRGAEASDPMTQFSQQLKMMMGLSEMLNGGRTPASGLDKLIDAGAGLATAFLEGGGAEAIGTAIVQGGGLKGMQAGQQRQAGGGRRAARARIIEAESGEQLSGASPAASTTQHIMEEAAGEEADTSDLPVAQQSLSDQLTIAINNFVVMINYCMDGNPQYNPRTIAEYVLYTLNEIGLKAQEIEEQTGEPDPVMDNLVMVHGIIRKSPGEISGLLSLLGMKEAKLRPLVKRLKTREGQATIAEICKERDTVIAENEGDQVEEDEE